MAYSPDRGIRGLFAVFIGCLLALSLVACGGQAEDAMSVGDAFVADGIEYKLSDVEQKSPDALSMQPMAGERLPEHAKAGSRFVVVTVDARDTSGKALDSSLLGQEALAIEIDGESYDPMTSTGFVSVQDQTRTSLSTQFEVPTDAEHAELIWDATEGANAPATFVLW